jgi:hypothetical protein
MFLSANPTVDVLVDGLSSEFHTSEFHRSNLRRIKQWIFREKKLKEEQPLSQHF